MRRATRSALVIAASASVAAGCDRAERPQGDGAPRDSTARRDTIIGRDSAFGPTHAIDSLGRITPIPKRPPTDSLAPATPR